MTQIGEGVATGAGKDPKGPDLEDNHWLELEYLYQNGTPLYGTYRATDSEGMEWNGRLNDQGQVCLAGLPAGKVRVDLLPETSDDKALKATRRAIQKVLDQIIADQKAEAEEYERDLENLGGPRRVYRHIHKVGESVWNAALGVVELAETATHKLVEISNFLHPVNLLGNNLKAAYKSYQDGELTREQWYDSINQNLKDEHQKELARIFGIEPDDLSKERLQELMALIAEAYDVAAFIADDSETQAMLKQFAKDMAATQHSMEWAEFSGAVVFELILAALLAVFTAGIGTAAQAGTKLRHTAEMRKLAPLFRKLAEQLRNKKLNKQVDVPVDTPTTTKTDQPDPIELEAKSSQKNKALSHTTALSRQELESAILAKVGSDFKNSPLRQSYEREVAALSKYQEQLKPGMSVSEKLDLAEEANEARRALGVKYKDATPEPLRDYIYEVNRSRYDGDPLGPTVEFLVNEKGKSYTDIIESASRPNPSVDKLLSGFGSWLKNQPDDYLIKHGASLK